jgi:hypothetical protein
MVEESGVAAYIKDKLRRRRRSIGARKLQES